MKARLVYSPDDRGYYWERQDWKRSQVFPTADDARRALRNNACIWTN